MKKTLVLSCFFLLGITALAQAGYYDDPTHSGVPNSLACEECHGGPDWNTPGAAHPNLLRNDSAVPASGPEVCSDCHNDLGSRSATYPLAAKVLTHQRNCWDCHQNHQDAALGYTNQNYVTETMDVCADDPSVVCTTDADCGTTCGSPILFNDPLVHTQPDGSGICQVCHTATLYWRADGTLQGHNATMVCTDCHQHSAGFSVSGGACTACHGEPPLPDPPYTGNQGLVSGANATGSVTIGIHEVHAVPSVSEDGLGAGQNPGYGFDCSYCHQGGMLSTVVIDGSNNIGFKIPFANSLDTFNNPEWQYYSNLNIFPDSGVITNYGGQTTVNYIGDWNGTFGTKIAGAETFPALGDGTMTCSSVYCHSSGRSILWPGYQPAGVSPPWDGSWTDADGNKCNNCHSDVPTNDSHRVHVVIRNLTCNNCHFGTVDGADYPAIPTIIDKTLHVNGMFDVSPSPTWWGGTNQFTYTPAPNGGSCSFAPDAAVSCHYNFSSAPKPTATWNTLGDDTVCGNQIVEGFEDCDDGNTNDYDACSNTCVAQTITPTGPCNDADNDSYISIADVANNCYVAGAPTTTPPYDFCDNDPTTVTGTTYYEDLDNDGYGSNVSAQFCVGDDTTGYVLINGDCQDLPNGVDGIPGNDDDGANINPAAPDLTVDGIDQNCDGIDGPAISFHFPTVLDSEGIPFYASFSVQNLDTLTPADYVVECYNLDGSPSALVDPLDSTQSVPNFPPIANSNIRQAPAGGTDAFRPAGVGTAWETRGQSFGYTSFSGACTVTSAQPVLVMLSLQNTNGSGAYTVFDSAPTAVNMNFPKVFDRTDWFWETWLNIYNPTDIVQNVTVSVYDGATNALGGTETVDIQPKATYRKRPSQILDGGFGQNWIQGYYLVTSNTDPLPAQVSYQHHTGNVVNVDKVSVYGTVQEANTLYFPFNFETAGLPADGAVGPFEAINLVSATVQSATIELYLNDGTPASTSPVTINFTAPNEQIVVRPAEYAGVPLTQTWAGVVKVTATQPITGISSLQYTGAYSPLEQSYAFLFPAAPANTLYFPKAFDYSAWSWTNTLSIMNTTAVDQTVFVDFIRLDGVNVLDQPFVVPGNGAAHVKPSQYNGGYQGDPAYFAGSLTVKTAPADPPVSAVLQYGYYPNAAYIDYFGRLEVYNGLTDPTGP